MRLSAHPTAWAAGTCERCWDSNNRVWGQDRGRPRFCFGATQQTFPLTLLNDFMVFSSVNDLVIHCWAPLSWSSPLISTKLTSSLPRFLLPCSRLNWKRKKKAGVGALGGRSGDPESTEWFCDSPVSLHPQFPDLPCAIPPFTPPLPSSPDAR